MEKACVWDAHTPTWWCRFIKKTKHTHTLRYWFYNFWLTKKKRETLRTPRGTAGEENDRNKLAILFMEGCLGACIWCYRCRLIVSLFEVTLQDRAGMGGAFVTSHCCNLDNNAYVYTRRQFKISAWSSLASDTHYLTIMPFRCDEMNLIAKRRDLLTSRKTELSLSKYKSYNCKLVLEQHP